MKVYVDKLPKSCLECPCFQYEIECGCGLDDGTKDYFLDEIDGGECPLKSLTEHDKQIKKEMCERIRKFAYNTFKEFGCFDETDLEHILDTIQGECK